MSKGRIVEEIYIGLVRQHILKQDYCMLCTLKIVLMYQIGIPTINIELYLHIAILNYDLCVVVCHLESMFSH